MRISLLDVEIEEEVNKLPLSNINKNHCRRFIKILLRDGERFNNNPFSFTDKPYNFLKSVFGKNYKKNFLQVLIESGVIIVDNRYSTTLNLSKRYKVNPKFQKLPNQEDIPSIPNHQPTTDLDPWVLYVPSFLQGSDYQSVTRDKIRVKLKSKKNTKYMNLEEDFKKCASELRVNFNKLEGILEKYVNGILPNSFNINYAVKRKVIPIQKDDGSILYLSKTQALDYTMKRNTDIIEDLNGRIVIDDLFKFIVKKRHSVTESYLESLINLSEKNFYADRNETNNRLDTNLTNFPTLLLKPLLEDNGLVEIDLCNSQFAIFAHLIPEDVVGDDVSLFKTLSQECELYPYLQEKMALSSRKEAKTVCFEVCFSSHKNHSQYVTEMRKLFPKVMRWVDDFKKQNGDNQFAIMLQKKEAEIFIDNLYVMIREEDIFCLTKHDSLIVKAEDEYKVRNIVEEYFEENNFKAVLR